jgi:hypothetical protein
MARSDGLPPPSSKGGKRKPDMMEEDPSIYGKLSSLAGGGQPGGGGMPPGMMGGGGGGGGEGEAASLIQSGVSQLVQAAQMHPQLQPIIAQVIDTLRSGIGGIAGEGGGEEPLPEGAAPTKSKRSGPPKSSPPKRERGGMMGEESGY